MKKRSILTMVFSLALVGAVGVGSTLAYLSSSATKTNSFTVGKIETTLTEPKWEAAGYNDKNFPNLVPGMTVAKDPTLTIKGDSEDAALYMKLEMPKAVYDLWGKDKITFGGLKLLKPPTAIQESGWYLTGSQAIGDTQVMIYMYSSRYQKTANDQSLPALFNSISLTASATSDDVKDLQKNVNNIKVSSFAIQDSITDSAVWVKQVNDFAGYQFAN